MGYLWIAWIVLLVIMAFFQLVAARQQTKWRFFSAGKHVFRAVWAVIVFAVMFAISGVPVHMVWAAVFAVVGLALGFVTGRICQTGTLEGKTALKRAPYAPWMLAIVYIAAFTFLFFGSALLYSVGLLLVIFAVATDVGAIVAEIMKGNSAAKVAAA